MARFNATNMMLAAPGYPLVMPNRPGMMMGPASGAMAGAAVGSGSPAGQSEMHIEVQQTDSPPPPPPDAPPSEREAMLGYLVNPSATMISCVGDFNCPGNMKCCSNDMNVYV